MNTCDTCRYWERVPDEKQGQCHCSKIVDCSDYDSPMSELPDDAAAYEDSEHYEAFFRLGPKFGCIHHTAR